ncbi:MAG: Hsp70 family protein, partial [Thermodesulfobacteriota bacterium]
HVLQGEREMVSDNISLARFNLVDIPLAPKGIPQIEVSYEVDADGILHVSAHDLGTDNIQNIDVENSSGLSDSEIEELIKESSESKVHDKQKKEIAMLRNEAEGLIYSVNKTLTTYGDRIDDETESRINSELENLEAAVKGDDYNSLNIALKSLQDVSYKFAQAIYTKKDSSSADSSKTLESKSTEIGDS